MTIKRYRISYTDSQTEQIVVPRKVFIEDIVDITLIGKRTEEYGQTLNENILRLLEHFACHAVSEAENLPDPSQKQASALENPTVGQLWYNKTTGRVNCWNGMMWSPINSLKSVAGNSGVLMDGEQIPVPTKLDGSPYDISACAVNVSPAFIDKEVKSFTCEMLTGGIVSCKFTDLNDVIHSGYASYIIICN